MIREFVTECCILNDEGKTYTHELYEAYKKFCIKKGFRSVPEQGFGQRLSKVCDGKIEHSKWRTGGNPENGWLGITLIKYKEHSVKHMTI